jgi:invasion protein IalB
MRIPSIKCAIIPALAALHLLAFQNSSKADDPRATQLTFEPWKKFCIGGAGCFVGVEARGACSPSGGVVMIQTVDGKATKLSATVGTKRTPEGDIRVQIDQYPPIPIAVSNCYASGCTGTLEINDALVQRMKRSSSVTLEATTTDHGRISLSFPLADFTQAYDGPGTEPKVYEEFVSEEKMKERMQQEEEQKKALECKE